MKRKSKTAKNAVQDFLRFHVRKSNEEQKGVEDGSDQNGKETSEKGV